MTYHLEYFNQRVLAEIQSWPVRPHGRSGQGRALYCFVIGKRVVVLHAFIKKSQRTPESDLKLARKRLKEVQHD